MATMFSGFHSCTLSGVSVTDRVLGHGSYAIVLELEYNGRKCAGKKIHDVLLEQGNTTYSVLNFEKECRLLSQLHHPNIVKFFGIMFLPDPSEAPILVMEYLSTDLTSCINKHGILPQEIGYSILHDVANGLDYLHNQHPPVIHRDLTCNNVLLDSNMAAKISDLGVAKIVDLSPLQVSRMTQTPGTPAYMPPEVMIANPKYNPSIDKFSYGILIIHVLSGTWPEPHVEPVLVEADKLIPVSEAERRRNFLEVIGYDHLLMELILRCINNNPQLRPHSGEIVNHLASMVTQFPCSSSCQLREFTCTDVVHKDTTKRDIINPKINSTQRRPKARKALDESDVVKFESNCAVVEKTMSFEKHLRKAKSLFVRKPQQKPLPKDRPSAQIPGPIFRAYPLCVAKCSYNRSDVKELSIKTGDLLHIISDKHKWWFVQSQETGAEGFIPSNYVIRLPDKEEIAQSQIQLVDKVGEGRFSNIWKGTMYAVLPVTVKISKPACAPYSHEAAQLCVLKHPNIVQLYGICSMRVPMYTVLEYMKHGSLCEYLRGEGKSLNHSQLINIASQVASGMSYLEQRMFVHRDLAAKNVLVRDTVVCKVANFELARIVNKDDHVIPSGMDLSFKWTAPECILHHSFTVKSDVWSFGIVLYEIVTYGRLPYPGLTNAHVLELVQQGYRMPRPMHCPDKVFDIMCDCWREDPECRPTFETLVWQLEELFT